MALIINVGLSAFQPSSLSFLDKNKLKRSTQAAPSHLRLTHYQTTTPEQGFGRFSSTCS